ncbi:follicle-stimulating hormone receptor isoform X2 [Wyeomyia smithii]|uniref:follicle-stimulating hormone receptor isoform X2 n=1 Tax=Wyeomyia smithii TaxID=174621 RepID=UPI0024680E6C|nr:follicle-stimulating hormone receptor isoform X2 [Wyeomyia smithii]
MSACISNRVKRKVYWYALILFWYILASEMGGIGKFSMKQSVCVQGIPVFFNDSVSTVVTAVDQPLALSATTHPEMFPDSNHTLLLEINSTALAPDEKKSSCRCWNSIEDSLEEVQCKCEGHSIMRIPQKLAAMHKLILENIGTKRLRENALLVYADCLKDLRIIHCGLLAVPDMRMLSDRIILHMVDLDGNQIREIPERAIRIKTDELILDNNEISHIYGDAFNGSQVAKLSLKLNFKLKHIDRRAFAGIQNIRELDLSSTAIEAMPSDGLNDLETLRIQNTHSLKTIPSVYNFKNLQTAFLTHSFHCCAFKFPARHDPTGHEEDLRRYYEEQKKCNADGYPIPSVSLAGLDLKDSTVHTGEQMPVQNVSQRRKRYASLNEPGFGRLRVLSRNLADAGGSEEATILSSSGKDRVAEESFFQPITGFPVDDSVIREDVSDLYSEEPISGTFHDTIQPISTEAICGNLTPTKFDVKCYPMPDALNPCEDVMGSHWLRGSVWVVVLLAVFGNVAVLVVLFSNRSDLTVPRFLICHLAFADLCMGLYLLLIASIDAHSMGEYFNFAFDWQYGSGCKVAGFLTVFASHLSIFTLTIVTLERWFAITHAIYLNHRIKFSAATYIMISGWIYSFVMAALPLFGISNYSSTSICLPMEARDSWDIAYLLTVLGINGLAFIIIVICYAQIYFSLGKETRNAARTAHHGEMTVAKKMALLVFTNFACWAPIAFFGLTAIAGYPLIDVTKSKILLVFFYPLNSCANPYLYAIMTMQYRKDLFMLLSNYGLCTQRAQQYKITYSMPTNTIQIIPARGSITATTINSNTFGTIISSTVTEVNGSRKTMTINDSINNVNGQTNIVEVVEEEHETFL